MSGETIRLAHEQFQDGVISALEFAEAIIVHSLDNLTSHAVGILCHEAILLLRAADKLEIGDPPVQK